MFFYRYNIAERRLDKYGCVLHEQLLKDKATLVSNSGRHIYKWHDKSAREIVYFMVDPLAEVDRTNKKLCPAIIGFCSLTKRPRWKALETSMLYVNSNYRRSGVALELYDAIMADGVIVISGYSHNRKSRSLWTKLVNNGRYVTWAQDILNLRRTAAIEIDEFNNFDCNLKLYEDIKNRRKKKLEDIRIIAYNPECYEH